MIHPYFSSDLLTRLRAAAGDVPEEYLYVNTSRQQAILVRRSASAIEYPVSTSRYGIGSRENSYMTPQGIHAVVEKIGHGAPSGRIFKNRCDTGNDWDPSIAGENLILTRILRLRGLEPGINAGEGIDSYDRYIYLHGTNREAQIGTPVSHGCICLRNADIIDLFDLVKEGTIVVID